MRSARLCCSWPWTRIVDVWLDVSQSRFNPDVATLGRQVVAELSRYICHLPYFAGSDGDLWPICPATSWDPFYIIWPCHAAHFVGNLWCWCGGFGCWQARMSDVRVFGDLDSILSTWRHPPFFGPPQHPSPLYLPNTFPACLSPPALSFNPSALSRPSLAPLSPPFAAMGGRNWVAGHSVIMFTQSLGSQQGLSHFVHFLALTIEFSCKVFSLIC